MVANKDHIYNTKNPGFSSRGFLFSFLLLCCVFFAQGQAVITFDQTAKHLGFLHKGDTAKFAYVFTNTGNQPLIVSETKVECGCTIVEKPEYQINPGKRGEINVMFITTHTIDRQDRTVTVVSNASNSPTVLRFKCVVLAAKK